MNFLIRLALVLSITLVARAYEPPSPSTGVEVLRFEWHDSARDRDVPAKVYFPKTGAGDLPVVIFSHGLGGSREGYEYLGLHWAGCGYISVHLQHQGSDDALWKNVAEGDRMKALSRSVLDIRNSINRPRDVSFAIDQLNLLNADAGSPLHARIDLQRIAVAGHSFGGFTAMALAGQALGPQGSTELADPRIKCAIEMSAPVPRVAMRDHSYGSVSIPVFHMSGTKDDSPLGDTKAADRRIPYELTTNAETCLVIFNGGDHMVFSGRLADREARASEDAKFQRLICTGTTAFLDAFLKATPDAHGWLMDGGYGKFVGDEAVFEAKAPAK